MAEKKETKDQSAELQKETTDRMRESGGRPADGNDDVVLIKADGKGSVPSGKAEAGESFVTIEKDVVLEVQIENAKRPSHILLFRKGQVVSQSELDARTKSAEG